MRAAAGSLKHFRGYHSDKASTKLRAPSSTALVLDPDLDRRQRFLSRFDLPGKRRGGGPALDPLRLEPAAALQHLVEGVVEALGGSAQLLRRQLGERLALLDRVADQAADDAVRLAEG